MSSIKPRITKQEVTPIAEQEAKEQEAKALAEQEAKEQEAKPQEALHQKPIKFPLDFLPVPPRLGLDNGRLRAGTTAKAAFRIPPKYDDNG